MTRRIISLIPTGQETSKWLCDELMPDGEHVFTLFWTTAAPGVQEREISVKEVLDLRTAVAS